MKYQIYYDYECGCRTGNLTFDTPVENSKIKIKNDLGVCRQCNEERVIRKIKKRKTDEKGNIVPDDEVING
jgi:hypothetical protein